MCGKDQPYRRKLPIRSARLRLDEKFEAQPQATTNITERHSLSVHQAAKPHMLDGALNAAERIELPLRRVIILGKFG
jgi:hypothetical protein